MLHTVVKLGFGRKLNIINLHLGLNDTEREKQLKEVETFVKSLEDPYIVVGDFNDGNMNINEEIFKDAATKVNKDNTLTFSTALDRIDYILVSPDIEVIDYDVLMKNMSDHYPIVSKFKI